MKRKYRGKYPERICSVTSSGGVAIVITNDGKKWTISASDVPDRRYPRLGEEIGKFVAKLRP